MSKHRRRQNFQNLTKWLLVMFTTAIYHQDTHNKNVKWQNLKQISPKLEMGKCILHSKHYTAFYPHINVKGPRALVIQVNTRHVHKFPLSQGK